jgi:hypothetical protein
VLCTDFRTNSYFALFSIKMVFITEIESVYCAVRTEIRFVLEWLIIYRNCGYSVHLTLPPNKPVDFMRWVSCKPMRIVPLVNGEPGNLKWTVITNSVYEAL